MIRTCTSSSSTRNSIGGQLVSHAAIAVSKARWSTRRRTVAAGFAFSTAPQSPLIAHQMALKRAWITSDDVLSAARLFKPTQSPGHGFERIITSPTTITPVRSISVSTSALDLVEPECGVVELRTLFKGDEVRAEQEMKWLEDKQRFDNEDCFSLSELVRQRLQDIVAIRELPYDSVFLELLIGPCYALEAARLELGWLREHLSLALTGQSPFEREVQLYHLCQQRHQGVPLQYILSSEYFGDIKLQCRPGVLIPRQDTADHVMHLLERFKNGAGSLPRKLRVLDLCCGSGCMGLLMAHSFPYKDTKPRGMEEVEAYGIDISDAAIDLAQKNRTNVIESIAADTNVSSAALRALDAMKFFKLDILQADPANSIKKLCGPESFDIVLCNPPYIGGDVFDTEVALSVRISEPVEALVPPLTSSNKMAQADLFYGKVMEIAGALDAKVVLMEVGSEAQGRRQQSLFAPCADDVSLADAVRSARQGHLWASPRLSFKHDESNEARQEMRYGTRGWVVYSHRMDAKGWVGP